MEALIWPAAAVVSSAIFMLVFKEPIAGLITRARRIGKDGLDIDPSLPQSSAVAEANKQGEKFSAAEQIQSRKSENVLFAQIEARIQEQLDGLTLKDAKEREKYLIHILAETVVARNFERAYSLIWGSQLQALVTVNGAGAAGIHPDHLLHIYEQAKTDYPRFYSGNTFDQWLGFLVSQQLVVIKEPVVQITLAGREFLKYIVDTSKQGYKEG